MIRFIIKRRFQDNYSGAVGEAFVTLLLDVPELQAEIDRGGYGPSGHDLSELVGIELVQDHQQNAAQGGGEK